MSAQITLILSAIVVFRQQQRRLLLVRAPTPTAATVSEAHCNPLFEREGPPPYQPSEQPLPFTATPTQGFDRTNVSSHKDHLASAAEYKTAGVK